MDKLAEILEHWWEYTAILVLLALEKGIFENVDAVIAASVQYYKTVQQRASELATPPADGAGRGGMKDCGAETKLKHAQINVLRVGAQTMASPQTRCLANLLVAMLKPSRTEHGKSITIQKTRRGTRARVAAQADGEWQTWLCGLAGILRCPETLKSCGISLLHEPLLWDQSEEQENMLAMYCFSLQVSLLGAHVLRLLAYSWSFPMCVFGLIHDDREVVSRSLKRMEKIWSTWEAAENAGNGDVDDILHQIIWTSWQWPRLVLLELAEHSFELVPDSLRTELVQASEGPQTTKTTEDVFREPRQAESATPSVHIARLNRWHTMVVSLHLRESDRPAPSKTSASKSLAQQAGWLYRGRMRQDKIQGLVSRDLDSYRF